MQPRILAIGRDVALVLVLFATVSAVVLYAAFGFRANVLNGHSMEPTLSDSSLVITRAGSGAAVGDIVKFKYNGIPTIHRVVGVTSEGLIETKGDNASLFPEARPVPASRVEGHYVASLPPLHGTWRFFFERPATVVLIVAGLLVALPLLKGSRREPGTPVLGNSPGG